MNKNYTLTSSNREEMVLKPEVKDFILNFGKSYFTRSKNGFEVETVLN
jgi:hypothetical protein